MVENLGGHTDRMAVRPREGGYKKAKSSLPILFVCIVVKRIAGFHRLYKKAIKISLLNSFM